MHTENFKRIFAFLIDLAVVDLLITRPLSKLISEDFNFDEVSDLLNISFELILIASIIGLFGVFYWAVLEYKIGQTLGALIFKLRARSLGKGMSFPQAFLRNLTKISVVLLLIDSINILFSEKKQRYFEMFSKTVTLEER
ncbi:RDD family protein [Candidatus Woesearchaeota archaeon]|nr:RDD family protein [Candidatus Woesearchaeota archaeon]